nr:unnamed protein product [Digitaria exilis]
MTQIASLAPSPARSSSSPAEPPGPAGRAQWLLLLLDAVGPCRCRCGTLPPSPCSRSRPPWDEASSPPLLPSLRTTHALLLLLLDGWWSGSMDGGRNRGAREVEKHGGGEQLHGEGVAEEQRGNRLLVLLLVGMRRRLLVVLLLVGARRGCSRCCCSVPPEMRARCPWRRAWPVSCCDASSATKSPWRSPARSS